MIKYRPGQILFCKSSTKGLPDRCVITTHHVIGEPGYFPNFYSSYMLFGECVMILSVDNVHSEMYQCYSCLYYKQQYVLFDHFTDYHQQIQCEFVTEDTWNTKHKDMFNKFKKDGSLKNLYKQYNKKYPYYEES